MKNQSCKIIGHTQGTLAMIKTIGNFIIEKTELRMSTVHSLQIITLQKHHVEFVHNLNITFEFAV